MRTMTWGAGLLVLALPWSVAVAQEPVLDRPAPANVSVQSGKPVAPSVLVEPVVQQPLIQQSGIDTRSQSPISAVPIYRPYREETTTSTAQRMIHERAAYKAQQRRARLESMKWLGVSSSRPTISVDVFLTEQNPISAGWQGGFGYGVQSARKSPWSRY
jgi:hypothetical protein